MKAATLGVMVLALALTLAGALPGIAASMDRQFQPPPGIGLPEQFACVFGQATALSAVTFLCAEGYTPWVAMIVEPGWALGIDRVEVSFDGVTLRIEVTDEDEGPRNVIILVNSAFVDEHLDSQRLHLNFETSEAANFQGLQGSHAQAPAGIGGPFYVFVIDSFSTQWVQISKGLPVLFIVAGVVAAVVVLGAVAILLRRRR